MSALLPAHLAIIPGVSINQLRQRLVADAEIALIDVREQGVKARDGHILRSAGLPLSQLELRAATLLPRLNAPVIVTDAGDEVLARRAAALLQSLGYNQVSVLLGGVAAWQAQGGELFTGTSALSKGFGEFVEHQYGTPHLSAAQLKQRLDAGEHIVLLDGRTLGEFANFSIPGALACPNGELVYRVHPLLADEQTPVVVNCAGRTRSIIGAQTLINAGLKNPVLALENGTMDWLSAGFTLQTGVEATVANPEADQLQAARQAAAHLIEHYQLRTIDLPTLAQYQLEASQRTLYVYDVRTRAEYQAGHLPGARWAEGGQLVQGVDVYVGVQNARVVLVDDARGVRAATAASWLAQIGWSEVVILKVEAEHATETGPDRGPLLAPLPAVDELSPEALAELLALDNSVLLDLDNSLAYAAGHIPGARFAIRSRLDQRLAELSGDGPIVLTSADGRLARLAVAQVKGLSERGVKVLAGGTQAWIAAGLPLETGDSLLWDTPDDVWRSPYQVDGDRQAAFRAYLDWELGLVEQLQRDGTARFKIFPVQGLAA
jgi:rhodanese-related sulfurtransferase